MKIKNYLNEIDNIFKFEKEPTITFKNGKGIEKNIFITAFYTQNKQGKEGMPTYHTSMEKSNKYLLKTKRKKETLDYVKTILKKEGFKNKIDKSNKSIKNLEITNDLINEDFETNLEENDFDNKIYSFHGEMGVKFKFKPIKEVKTIYNSGRKKLLIEVIDGGRIAWDKNYFEKTKSFEELHLLKEGKKYNLIDNDDLLRTNLNFETNK